LGGAEITIHNRTDRMQTQGKFTAEKAERQSSKNPESRNTTFSHKGSSFVQYFEDNSDTSTRGYVDKFKETGEV